MQWATLWFVTHIVFQVPSCGSDLPSHVPHVCASDSLGETSASSLLAVKTHRVARLAKKASDTGVNRSTSQFNHIELFFKHALSGLVSEDSGIGGSHAANHEANSTKPQSPKLGVMCRPNRMGLVFPAFLAFVVAGGYLFFELAQAKHNEMEREIDTMADTTIRIGCFFSMLDNIIFTMVIPDSYGLVQALGAGAVTSGVLIGSIKLGHILGALPVWMMSQAREQFWRTRSGAVFMTCATLNTFASIAYTLVAVTASRIVTAELLIDTSTASWLLVTLIVARVLGGVAGGMRIMIARGHVARMSPTHELPTQQARLLYAITLGMALGPLVSSAAKILAADGTAWFVDTDDRAPKSTCWHHGTIHGHLAYEVVGVVMIALSVCQIVAAAKFPSMLSCHDYAAETAQQVSETANADGTSVMRELQRRRLVVCCCFAFSATRGLCVSGVEAATALLLETDYGWRRRSVGFAIGLAFLTCIPTRMMYTMNRKRYSTVDWIRGLQILALAGSLLLFSVPMSMAEYMFGWDSEAQTVGGAALLLLGDALLFPSYFLNDGLVQGVLLQHLLPRSESVFNLNTVNLLNVLLLDSFARSSGPPLVRFEISQHGQNGYALQQICLVIFGSLFAYFGFLPQLKA